MLKYVIIILLSAWFGMCITAFCTAAREADKDD